jgi:hypothetical protein
MKYGQVQAVSAVLITSVVIGAIGTVYVWGVPMLNKQQSQSDVSSFESNVDDLYEGIVSVAESSPGSTDEIQIEADQIFVNTSANYVDVNKDFEDPVGIPPFFNRYRGESIMNTTRGAGSSAIMGEDNPGVIFNRADEATGTSATYRIDFRNLCSPGGEEMSLIDLRVDGGSRSVDTSSVTVSNEGTQTDDNILLGMPECEGNYERKRTIVNLEVE